MLQNDDSQVPVPETGEISVITTTPQKQDSNLYNLEDRFISCLLCHMIGDILGAPVEGYDSLSIQQKYGILKDFVSGQHMGLYDLPERINMYTDDTNGMLALSFSLVHNSGLVPRHAARTYPEYWSTGVIRGYPDSAINAMKCVQDGKIPYTECGRIAFKDGSFANGGAMRIAPIALAYRTANDEQLYEAVRLAIISSHVHPEEFLNELSSSARTNAMKSQIELVLSLYKEQSNKKDDELVLNDSDIVKKFGSTFQIRAIEAIPCVLWCLVNSYKDPEGCIIRSVMMGGDTDTVAAMTGDIIGSLHGTSFIPKRWFDNIEKNNEENMYRGRDFAIDLAKKIFKLNLTEVLSEDHTNHSSSGVE
ncbi:unnamed protein product [Didymodactylos carnosus]|uniref:ADP-ribosylhydrolase ARH3 n=1 Tax=Didymodactylos carnosus TaxID=1234261 RepID=A0A8S2INC7_9BILA|nr:unnamed protein product [Didymodactylos carnosus]CAF3765690.1 unnamed protein product [Didymodactylos carnosus]